MKHFLKIGVAMMVTAVTGCDIVNDDVPPRAIEATAFAFADKPAIVNIAGVSAGRDLIAAAGINPRFGKLEVILGGKYILYTPTAEFKGKDDALTLKLNDSKTNQAFSDLYLTFKSLDNGRSDCSGLSGVYDYARIKQGEHLTIDLLNNDVFCGVGYNGGIIGEVALENINTEDFELILGPGRIAKFDYTPKPGFTGKIKVIYNLGINWHNPNENTPDEDVLADPLKYLEAFTTAIVEVDVVE